MNKEYDRKAIQTVVDEFKLSEIQSESEVRSKFIVRLMEALGYPSYLRGEEFPVYGYGGSKALGAKNADFIFFDDKSFGKYRGNTQNNKRWVQAHSLLIIEAKKPGKLPEDLGQAQFYTMWTKAVAYIETDGVDFKGYFFSTISNDVEIIDSQVEELADKPELWHFSYENILAVKQNGSSVNIQDPRLLVIANNNYQIITDDSVLNLSEETLEYVKQCMGRNAEGLTDLQILNRFLNITNSILQNDIRYDIPPYMIDIPRNFYEAKLYIDDTIFPLVSGEIIECYCNDNSQYFFKSEYIDANATYKNGKLYDFEIGYHILNKYVVDRLDKFELVKKCFCADFIRIVAMSESGQQITLPIKNPGNMWKRKKQMEGLLEFWIQGMTMLKAIEEYYEFKFKLCVVRGKNALNELYDAISFVYDGMMLRENCKITMPGDLFDEDFVIDNPILLEENKTIPLRDRNIYGYIFRPYRSAVLPCRLRFNGKNEKDIVVMPGCCEYRLVEYVDNK